MAEWAGEQREDARRSTVNRYQWLSDEGRVRIGTAAPVTTWHS